MKKSKKIISMLLTAIMVLSVGCIGAFAGTLSPAVHYGTKPQQIANLPFSDSMNGINSNTGLGFSDFYFNCGATQRVVLDMTNVYVQPGDGGASVTMTIKNWNTGVKIVQYTFTTNSDGEIPASSALQSINFPSQCNFYVELSTTPKTTHFYGEYTLR